MRTGQVWSEESKNEQNDAPVETVPPAPVAEEQAAAPAAFPILALPEVYATYAGLIGPEIRALPDAWAKACAVPMPGVEAEPAPLPDTGVAAAGFLGLGWLTLSARQSSRTRSKPQRCRCCRNS